MEMYSKHDLERLMDKSISYLHSRKGKYSGYQECSVVYRNKSASYFNHIMKRGRRGGNGIMATYIKDNNGDPRCPINNRLDGLFFSCNMDFETGEPSKDSPFGERRLRIDAYEMLFLDDYRMYFSDFYCFNSKKRGHYVNIVVATPGSEADDFCKQHLVAISRKKNPFIHCRQGSKTVRKSCGVRVEIFFTDDVNIKELLGEELATFEDCECTGYSKPNGLPKNLNCPHCNLEESDDSDTESCSDSDDSDSVPSYQYSPQYAWSRR